MPRRRKDPPPAIGWREWVCLPGLSDELVKAKIDTGARTSALHASSMRIEVRDGVSFVRFELHHRQETTSGSTTVEVPVVDYRQVRSSTGHAERRPVIRTPIVIGEHRFEIDITLTSRHELGFQMLLGRSALQRRFVVDVARSFVQSS